MSSGEDCKKLVADLASQFYDLGWFPGSGGSLTMRKGSMNFHNLKSNLAPKLLLIKLKFILVNRL